MRLPEIVVLLLFVEMLTPATVIVGLKKSKILLLLITLPVLSFGLAVPSPMTPLVGRLAPAGPMLLVAIVLLLLPPATVLVLKRMLPVATVVLPVDEPRMVQLRTMLFEAPPMNRIVLVPAVAEAVVFESVRELPMILRPSIVTLSAPFRSTNGLPAAIAGRRPCERHRRDSHAGVGGGAGTAGVQDRRERLGSVAQDGDGDRARVRARVNGVKCVLQGGISASTGVHTDNSRATHGNGVGLGCDAILSGHNRSDSIRADVQGDRAAGCALMEPASR